MNQFLGNKKVRIAIVAFILLIIVISIIFVIFNPAKKDTGLKPGGQPGTDYVQTNSIAIENNYILYRYLGDANTNLVTSMLESAVLYNVSISNDPNASSEYVQLKTFNSKNMKLYSKGKQYSVTVDDNKINSLNGTPWNYWFGLTADDGRKFRLDINANPDNSNTIISIKKTN